MTALRLNPALEVEAYAETFAREGVVQIRDVLEPEAAEHVAAMLNNAMPWEMALSDAMGGDETLTRDALASLGRDGIARKLQDVSARAASGFAYVYLCYPMIRAYVQRRDPGHPIHQVTEFINSRPFLDFGAAVIRAAGVTKADAQATFYRPNDFLTLHDDRTDQKAGTARRKAAYTLGFTRGWRPDWGGQLLFHDDAGEIERGLTPGFNMLTLFGVPRMHSVAPVAPYAAAPRLSVVGWLRDD
ncbi:2OG-Fe(II) oxygenase family protein [Caulobacter sp. 17J65-9]|uniref:2OG-Fe(II) oxygenase n=1 Tax=Caulobacter sp. 17J65-9 TaxID=2709382 RepID=UPI0013C5E8EE|nr:2OG-Fe(II) oxygenase family protein [Caulobacter sp. 17J65-9]NEX94292.1 proline hydroxylase [Caulobacter sp. 17J65-9]